MGIGIVHAVALLPLLVALAVVLTAPAPPDVRAGLSLRNPIPVDQVLRRLAREAHWPMVWVGEICDGPPRQLRGAQQLRHADYAAACPSKVAYGGDADYVVIARYAAFAPALEDVRSVGYEFYALTRWNGSLFLAGTSSDKTVRDPRGREVSPSLRPLETFGLKVIRG